MFYRALGFAVWKGAKWYVGRKLPSPGSRKLPSRKLMVGGALALGVGTFIAAGAKRDHGDSSAA
jgi:hypothetical protein